MILSLFKLVHKMRWMNASQLRCCHWHWRKVFDFFLQSSYLFRFCWEVFCLFYGWWFDDKDAHFPFYCPMCEHYLITLSWHRKSLLYATRIAVLGDVRFKHLERTPKVKRVQKFSIEKHSNSIKFQRKSSATIWLMVLITICLFRWRDFILQCNGDVTK